MEKKNQEIKKGSNRKDNNRFAGNRNSSSWGGNKGNQGRRPKRGKRPNRQGDGKSDFAQKVISVRRVARVVAGGRRFSFSTTVVIGDKNGAVGLGIGKAADTALAIEKAIRDARRHMIKIPRTKENSIPHETRARYCSSDVFIVPAKGRGLVAGSSVRTVLDLAGVADVTAKILSRSKNKLNNARAAMEALSKLEVERKP